MAKTVIQRHHIVYAVPEHKQREIVVRVYKGEHWIITHLRRRKKISKGFIKQLKIWMALNEENAVDLDEEVL